MMLDKIIRNMMVVASSGKRLCVGPVSVRLSVPSIDSCRRQAATAASILHCDLRDDEDRYCSLFVSIGKC